jgi:hypothetical protein
MNSPEHMIFNFTVSSEHDVKLEGISPFETEFECNLISFLHCLVAVCHLSYIEF